MKDISNYLIQQSISDSRRRRNENRANEVAKYIDYYNGDNTDQYIKDKFKSAAFQEVSPVNFNLTKRFIERMSRIYTLGANRNVKNPRYAPMIRNKDFKMKHVEKMTRLLGTVAMQITVKSDSFAEFYFDYNPIYNFNVHFADDDPFTPIAIVYPINMPVHDNIVDNATGLTYAYWDAETYKTYDSHGSVITEMAHGLEVMPFMFFHKDHMVDEFFCPGASDIISCNEAINILFTEMALGLRFQMFGQYVVTGFYANEKVQRGGSDEILVFPDESNFAIHSPKANVKDAIEAGKVWIDLVAQNNHLFVQFAQDGGEVPSGIALKIKDLERFEDYQDDIELWRHQESALYYLERAIAKNYGIDLPEEFAIDFNEPAYPMTVQDQIAQDDWDLANNMTTRAKLMVKYNNDLSVEEAKTIIDSNKGINGAESKQAQGGSIFGRVLGQPTEPE